MLDTTDQEHLRLLSTDANILFENTRSLLTFEQWTYAQEAYTEIANRAARYLYDAITQQNESATLFQITFTQIMLCLKEIYKKGLKPTALSETPWANIKLSNQSELRMRVLFAEIQAITHCPSSSSEALEYSKLITNLTSIILTIIKEEPSLKPQFHLISNYIARHEIIMYYHLYLKEHNPATRKLLKSTQNKHANYLNEHVQLKSMVENLIGPIRAFSLTGCLPFFKKENNKILPQATSITNNVLSSLNNRELSHKDPLFFSHYNFNYIKRPTSTSDNLYTQIIAFDLDDTLINSGSESLKFLHLKALTRFLNEAPKHVKFIVVTARYFTKETINHTNTCIDTLEKEAGKRLFDAIYFTSSLSKHHALNHIFYKELAFKTPRPSKRDLTLVDDRSDQIEPSRQNGFNTILVNPENSEHIKHLRHHLNMPKDPTLKSIQGYNEKLDFHLARIFYRNKM